MVYTSFETPPHLIAPAQVLEGALVHYYCGTEGDLRLAHLLVDNAIELLALAYLRSQDPDFKPRQGHHKTYVGQICTDWAIGAGTSNALLECHNQRNNFYHEIVAGAPARNAVYRYIREALTFAETILGRDYEDFETYTPGLGFLIATFKLEITLRSRGREKRPRVRFGTLQELPEHDQIDRLLDSEDELYPVTVDQLEVVTDCLSQLLAMSGVNEVELDGAWEKAIQLRTSLEGISYELA